MSTEPEPTTRMQTRFRWMAASVWLIAVGFIIFCADRRWLGPVFEFVTEHPGSDEIGHFVLVGGLACLLNLALSLRTWRALGCCWLLGGTLVAVLFTLEEISRLWFPARRFDLLDLVSDYAGIVFFGWLAKRVSVRASKFELSLLKPAATKAALFSTPHEQHQRSTSGNPCLQTVKGVFQESPHSEPRAVSQALGRIGAETR